MLCEICKSKTATVHLTEIVDGHRSESHLCQACAQKEGITIKNQLTLNELLGSLIAAHQQTDIESGHKTEKICPVCGMTMEMFGKQALLGCPKDYEFFENTLMPIIEKAQDGQSQHKGKIPQGWTPQKIADGTGSKEVKEIKTEKENEAEKIKKQLDEAVRSEDYELAAKLRDELKALQ